MINNNNLPNKIILNKNEKFKDNDGNVLDIEVVGEREHNKCYFKVKDIMKGFGMKSLEKNIIDENTKYELNIDYIYFNCSINQSFEKNTNKKKILNKKIMYLTYTGILRVLFGSYNKNVYKFITWAAKSLFIMQMGTLEQKQILTNKIMGINYDEAKKYINLHINDISCIYLIILGQVKHLRNSMNIDNNINDEKYICKYGFSKNLGERMNGHKQEFQKIKGVNLSLKNISLIDPLYISEAEIDIKQYVKSFIFKYENFKELLILSEKDFTDLEKHYNNLFFKYIGYNGNLKNVVSAINLRLKEAENEIKHIKYNCNKKIELQNVIHDKEIQKYENALLKKDLEIQNIINKYEAELSKKDKEIYILKSSKKSKLIK